MIDPQIRELENSESAILSELLCRFPKYLENCWIQRSDGTGYFGDGGNGEDGIRTNSNVLYTAALLAARATEFRLDEETASLLRRRARHLLRYIVDSHVTGLGACANGKQWGIEWQSAWWATKLALGARFIWNDLDDRERERIHAVVVAEAARQLNRIAPTGLHLDTKAEENAWDCEILACAIALLPNHPARPQWETKLIEFSANVFSSPHDRTSVETLDGEPVGELVYTCNIHGDFSLENHGSSHFCYVASPLISKAWCAYALSSSQCRVPEAIYHNVKQVWGLAEKTFLANRFAYIGGQDWARYTYGEYFIIPALVFLDHSFTGGRERQILNSRLLVLASEARQNMDGSFFGVRFTGEKFYGQYAKYETDCFCCLALAWSLRQTGEIGNPLGVSPSVSGQDEFQHISPEGQFCFARTRRWWFSFSWTTLSEDIPNICFVPLKDDSLAEWHGGNLVGHVQLPGHPVTVGVRAMRLDKNIISIEGTCIQRSRRGQTLVEHFLAIKFDIVTGVLTIHSKYVARSRLWIARVTGVTWRIPNDLFNGYRRTVAHEGGTAVIERDTAQRHTKLGRRKGRLFQMIDRVLRKFRGDRSLVTEIQSPWINIDGLVGLVVDTDHGMSMRHYASRVSSWGSLFVEQFETPKRHHLFFVSSGKTLLDSKLVVHAGTPDETRLVARNIKLANDTST